MSRVLQRLGDLDPRLGQLNTNLDESVAQFDRRINQLDTKFGNLCESVALLDQRITKLSQHAGQLDQPGQLDDKLQELEGTIISVSLSVDVDLKKILKLISNLGAKCLQNGGRN